MFPLHESTQRRVCRVAFALVCVLPTASLLAYALWLKTPVHRQVRAETLSRRTGTLVSVDQLLYPRPRLARMQNVVLLHSQSHETIANIRELEIASDRQRVTLYASQPQLAAGQIDQLWRQCQRLLLNESFPVAKSVRLIANDVTITDDDGEAQTLSTLRIDFEAHQTQRVITAAYQLAGQAETSHATVRVVHDDGKLTNVYWHTGEASLPISPWTAQLPWLKQLGEDCRFRGELTATNSTATNSIATDGWSGRMVGEFLRVDLNKLVSDTFAHKLSGRASIVIDEARFQGDRLTQLHGRLSAGPGVVSSALLRDATHEWNLKIEGEASSAVPTDKLVRYEAIAFDFRIDNGQLSLTGRCEDAPSGTIITTEGGQRYRAAAAADHHNPASLLRVLASEREANVPATDATRELIRWLPLTDESASQETEKPPQGHLRGGP